MTGIVVRSRVPIKNDYRKYEPALRRDFLGTCAYCTISRREAVTISFGIDHYIPQARCAALECVYENLMYCCATCNSYKRDQPSLNAIKRGFRFFNADVDYPSDHAEGKKGTFLLVGKTKLVGEFTIEALNLNRAPLQELRRIRASIYRSRDIIFGGIRSLVGQRLDALPKADRAKVLAGYRKLGGAVDLLQEYINNEIVMALCSSPLHDFTTDDKDRNKHRLDFLRKANALIEPMSLPDGSSIKLRTGSRKSRKRRT